MPLAAASLAGCGADPLMMACTAGFVDVLVGIWEAKQVQTKQGKFTLNN